MFLRQSTASQEVLLGAFLDDTDGKTAETGLTIANTDIKIWKSGGTTEASKNSGGATHIAAGRYYAVLDATDTDTVGLLELNVHVSGALPVRRQFYVLEESVYDALFAASAAGYQVPIWAAASSTVALPNTTISSTQKVDVETIKTQSVTCAAGVTVPSSIASPTNITAASGVTLGGGAHGGAAATLTLERIIVDSTTTNEPAVKLTGDGTSAGIEAYGTHGAKLSGSINGLWLAGSLVGAYVNGLGTHAINLVAGTAGDGVHIDTTSGHGIAGTIGGASKYLIQTLGTPSDLGSGATVAANLVDIEGQTDDIGVAGAGLTALGDTRLANLDATVSSRSTLTQSEVTGGAYALNSASFAFNAALDFTTTQKAATLARVTLVDTITSYTGNTPQTGDAFAYLGTNVGLLGANLTAADDAVIAAIGALNNLSQANVRTAVGLGAANLDTQLADLPTVAEFEARTLLAAAYGTAANQVTIAGYLDTEVAAILAAVDTEVAAIKAKTDQLVFTVANQVDANALSGGGGLDAAGVRAAVGLATANLDTQLADIPTVSEFNARTLAAAAYFDPSTDIVTTTDTTNITAILADTNELQSDWANNGRLDLILDARSSQTSVDDVPTNAELATALGTADDAVLAAIAALNNLSAAQVNTECDTALSDAGVTTARMAALTDWIDGGRLDLLLDAILDDTGTAGVALSAAICNKVADHVRRRTQANVEASSDGDTLSLGSEYGFIQQAQESNTTDTAGLLTVKKTDGTTTLGTRTIATDASADPVTGVS